MTLTYVALGLSLLALALASRKGRVKKLEEELARLKSVEWSYRELRRDLDARVGETRKHLALVARGVKVSPEAILSGRSHEEAAGEDEIRATIERAVKDNKIAVFMKGTPEQPACGFSATVVGIFNELGVPYAGINAVASPRFRGVLSAYSNWPTLPQVFVDGKLVGGCDIVKEMKESGELQKAVDAALKPAPAAS